MDKIEDILRKMQKSPNTIKYRDLCKVCDFYFGSARMSATSHRIYKTPWQGDPRVNIQNFKGQAKTYQVKQVLAAIHRLEQDND